MLPVERESRRKMQRWRRWMNYKVLSSPRWGMLVYKGSFVFSWGFSEAAWKEADPFGTSKLTLKRNQSSTKMFFNKHVLHRAMRPLHLRHICIKIKTFVVISSTFFFLCCLAQDASSFLDRFCFAFLFLIPLLRWRGAWLMFFIKRIHRYVCNLSSWNNRKKQQAQSQCRDIDRSASTKPKNRKKRESCSSLNNIKTQNAETESKQFSLFSVSSKPCSCLL